MRICCPMAPEQWYYDRIPVSIAFCENLFMIYPSERLTNQLTLAEITKVSQSVSKGLKIKLPLTWRSYCLQTFTVKLSNFLHNLEKHETCWSIISIRLKINYWIKLGNNCTMQSCGKMEIIMKMLYSTQTCLITIVILWWMVHLVMHVKYYSQFSFITTHFFQQFQQISTNYFTSNVKKNKTHLFWLKYLNIYICWLIFLYLWHICHYFQKYRVTPHRHCRCLYAFTALS